MKFANIMLYSYKGGTSDGKKGFINKDIVEQMWTPAPNTEPQTFPQWRAYGSYSLSLLSFFINQLSNPNFKALVGLLSKT